MKIFVCLCFALSFMDLCLCGDPINITEESGQNVTLICRAVSNGNVTALMLIRDDLDPRYVFLYRDEQINVNHHNPQYLGRTELHSLYITDGKVNLTITNVTVNDSAVYECRVQTEINGSKSNSESTFIHLHVAPAAPPGTMDGNRGEGGNEDGVSRGHVGLMVFAVLALVSLIVFMVIKVIRRKKINTPTPPDDAETPQLI